MRNMPKVIGTGQDVYNLLGMVQAGKLQAEELREAISGIEEEKYIFTPIIAISEDKRYVTTNYIAEAQKGKKAVCEGVEYTIKSVEHIAVASEEEEGTEKQDDKQTVIGLNADVAAEAVRIGVENPVSILESIGITQEELDSVKGVLAKYE